MTKKVRVDVDRSHSFIVQPPSSCDKCFVVDCTTVGLIMCVREQNAGPLGVILGGSAGGVQRCSARDGMPR